MEVPFAVADNFQVITKFGNDDFPVDIHVKKVDRMIEGHSHKEFQFMLGEEKATVVTVDGRQTLLSPGNGMFINAGVTHAIKPEDGISSSFICFMIHPKLIYGLNNSMFRRYYVNPVLESKSMDYILFNESISWHKAVIDILRKMDIVFKTKEYTYMLTVQLLFLELWTYILTYNSNRLKNTAVSLMSLVDKERMDKMLNFIVDNCHRKINLTMIAGEGCISNSECCRLFKKTANISPMEYVNNTRLLEAARLLTTTKMSITEIAYEVGFSNPSYFSEQFRKFMNVKPMEYRNKNV